MASIKTQKRETKNRRELIVDAGIRLFARTPFSEMTIAGVAREANCGHSLVYHYFKNINVIYDEGIAHVASLFDSLVSRINRKDANPDLIFVGIISRIVDFLKFEPMTAYYLNLLSFSHSGVPHSTKLVSARKKWVALFLDIINAGQKSNRLITTLTAEEIMHSVELMFQGIVGALMFNNPNDKTTFRPFEIYLPFLKGETNA